MIEQRVAGTRDEHLVSGVSQQLEQHAVRIAGTGSQDYSAGGDLDASTRVVRGDGAPCVERSGRLRLVAQSAGVGHPRKQIRRIVEPGAGRIRQREIDERLTFGSAALNGVGQSIRREAGGEAGGEHGS